MEKSRVSIRGVGCLAGIAAAEGAAARKCPAKTLCAEALGRGHGEQKDAAPREITSAAGPKYPKTAYPLATKK